MMLDIGVAVKTEKTEFLGMRHDAPKVADLTHSGVLSRNVLINVIAQLIPLFAAVGSIPIVIGAIGTYKFGLLSLIWIFVGSFSMFDFGLGRATTKVIAERLGGGRESEIPYVFWTSLILMLAIGFTGSVIMFLATPWIVHSGLNIPESLQADMLRSLRMISVFIPVLASTAGLMGSLEAQQQFMELNAIRAPMGVFYFLGPLMVLPFSRHLFPIVAVLLAGRIIGWCGYLFTCLRHMPSVRVRIMIDLKLVRSLLSMGGWMTVSNIISPLMTAMDRFMVGSLLSAEAVAYYSTPYDLVLRVLIIPSAFIGVFFPAFSTSFAENIGRTEVLFEKALKYLVIVMFPVVLTVVALGQNGLRIWLGYAFAQESATVMQVLAIGVFVCGLAFLPFSLLQGVGRPDITAKLHLAEFPLYALGLWFLVSKFGIIGAAFGWTLRVCLDAALLFVVSRRIMGGSLLRRPHAVGAMAAGLLILPLAMLQTGPTVKVCFLLAALGVFGWLVWSRILSMEERCAMLRLVGKDVHHIG